MYQFLTNFARKKIETPINTDSLELNFIEIYFDIELPIELNFSRILINRE